MKKLVFVTAVPALLAALPAAAQYSAKSLFFGTEGEVVSVAAPAPTATAAVDKAKAAKPATKVAAAKRAPMKTLGASYFVRLKRPDGSTQDVLASREFRSGERFQLGLKVNGPTYVHISNIGPDGTRTTLYPAAGQNGFVDAMGVVMLPPQGSFEFDDVPGTEQLSVVLSPQPLPREVLRNPSREADFVQETPVSMRHASLDCAGDAPAAAGVAVASLDAGYASKGIQVAGDKPSASACGSAPQVYASKGILVSDDPMPEAGGQVASYVVKKDARPSDSLTINLKLLHR